MTKKLICMSLAVLIISCFFGCSHQEASDEFPDIAGCPGGMAFGLTETETTEETTIEEFYAPANFGDNIVIYAPTTDEFEDSELFEPRTLSNNQLYHRTVTEYRNERKAAAAALGYDIDISRFYYAVRDINGDGTQELIIIENPESGEVCALYTIADGAVQKVLFIERHGQYRITADGYIEYSYKQTKLYRLDGTRLQIICDTADEDFKKQNGISTDYLKTELTEYNYVK